MNKIDVPTEDDWRSEPWCLDAEYAYGIFNGKTYLESLKLFEEHALGRQEDVMFMPNACFPFYFNVFMDYLMSEKSRDDPDAASCFLSLVVFKVPELKKLERWLIDKTLGVVAFIGENQEFFDADLDIYGSFKRKADEVTRKLKM